MLFLFAFGLQSENQPAAAHQFAVRNAVFLQRPATEGHRADVDVAGPGAFRFYNELPGRIVFRVERNGHLVENGRCKRIVRLPRAVRVEAHHREDRPRRHGARVVVAGDAVGGCRKVPVQQTPHLALRTPLLAPEIAEQVRIGDVGFVRRVVQPLVEDHLQLVDESAPAAHQPGQSGHVVRDIERIVPGRTFVEPGDGFEILALARVEGREEFTLPGNRTERARLGAVIVLIAERAGAEQRRVVFFAERVGQQR